MNFKNKKIYIKIIGIIVSIILIILTLKEVNLSLVLKEISKIDLLYFFISLTLMLIMFLFRGIRWFILIRHNVKFKNVYESLMIGYFIHNIVPFRIGEILRIYFLNSKSNISITYLLGTVIAERIIDGLSLLLIFFMFTIFTTIDNQFLNHASKILITGLLTFFLLYYLSKLIKIDKAKKDKKSFLFTKINQIVNKIIDGFHTFENLKIFIYVLSLSIIIWLIENIAIVFILKSFNINIKDIFINSIVPLLIINMGIMIPSGPGDLGMFEIAGKQGFGTFLNIDIHTAVSITLMFHLITLLPGFIIGGFYMVKYHLDIDYIKKE